MLQYMCGQRTTFKNQFSLSAMWVSRHVTQIHQACWQVPLPTEPSSSHLLNISLLKKTLFMLSSLKKTIGDKTTLGEFL